MRVPCARALDIPQKQQLEMEVSTLLLLSFASAVEGTTLISSSSIQKCTRSSRRDDPLQDGSTCRQKMVVALAIEDQSVRFYCLFMIIYVVPIGLDIL